MATLATGVVNAGFPTSGATVQVQRGTTPNFLVVKAAQQVYDNNTLRAVIPQTNFTANTARASLQYNNSVTFVAKVGTTPYQSIVKNVSQTSNDTSNIIKAVDTKTNPYYLINILKASQVNTNESKVGTTGFYHKVAPHTYTTTLTQLAVDPKTNLAANSINSMTITCVNDEPIAVMDNSKFNQTLGTRSGVVQLTPSEEPIFTIPFFHKVTNNPTGNNVPVSVMVSTTFNQTLGTRSGITITTPNEEPVAVFNINNSVTNLNSPIQLATQPKPALIVEQNKNSGRIDSSAVQPKGTEAGNIGFAQAFGNTTIVGKWF